MNSGTEIQMIFHFHQITLFMDPDDALKNFGTTKVSLDEAPGQRPKPQTISDSFNDSNPERKGTDLKKLHSYKKFTKQ
jgi:hypothetical protein